MAKKQRFWKKPFEGCIKVEGKGYTDAGFFDASEKDDEKFIRIVKRLRK